MAIIRQVRREENSRMWAYVEWSDENTANTIQILGNKHFSTKEEAEDYSKGFTLDSYDWIEPKEIKKNRLLDEKERLEKRLKQIEIDLIS